MKASNNDFKAHYEVKASECKAKAERCKAGGDLKGADMHNKDALNYKNAIRKI